MTSAQPDDGAIVAAIAAGERAALDELYHRYARSLWLRMSRRCADPDLVDTALQETFLSVWRSAGGYRPDRGDVGAWLWSIALRRLIDQLRRRRPPVPVAEIPEGEPLPPPGTPAHALLAALPTDLHSVVQAVYLDGLTTRETATLLGIPQGTVKSRLSRARPYLQEVLR